MWTLYLLRPHNAHHRKILSIYSNQCLCLAAHYIDMFQENLLIKKIIIIIFNKKKPKDLKANKMTTFRTQYFTIGTDIFF